ncbi:helix-hairpin-helix domain-containing protein [Marinomonas sp.]|nr:helix-hairpin-helix domain-containing protein [Marinomonas sp.]MDB4837716.1 helix-hairpin-helix domain-containing protein [Marinomonas sp.]
MKKQYDIIRTKLAKLLLISLAIMPFSLYSATPLDLNTATAPQLAAVMSGVGVKKAQAIVAYREVHGGFDSVDDLSRVKGIGEALLKRNKELIQVVPDTE